MELEIKSRKSQKPNVLTIGGIDSRSGGGITLDYGVIREYGCFPFSVATSTVSVFDNDISINELPLTTVVQQLKSLDAVEFSAIKIGFLPNLEMIQLVISYLEDRRFKGIRDYIVFDPVISFKEIESDREANENYLDHMIKLSNLSNIITPNLDEWKLLKEYQSFSLGNKVIIVKDAFPERGDAIDIVYNNSSQTELSLERINTSTVFGAGCTFSAIIVAKIADYIFRDLKITDQELLTLLEQAKEDTRQAIVNGIIIAEGGGKLSDDEYNKKGGPVDPSRN
jgi:pyridoxine kinase